jgi:hypothetical protein
VEKSKVVVSLKMSGSGVNSTLVPVLSAGQSPVIFRPGATVFPPLMKSISWILLSRQTMTLTEVLKALTALTPMP